MMIKNKLVILTKQNGLYFELTRVLLIAVFGFFCSLKVSAQNNQNRDSLEFILNKKDLTDSLRYEVLEELAKDRTFIPVERLRFAKAINKTAKNKKDTLWLYKSNLLLGHIYKAIGDIDEALEYYLNASIQAQYLKNKRREALTYSAIGSLYKVNEEYEKALYYFERSIFLLRKENDQKNLAITLNNSAQLYKLKNSYDSALLYFKEAGVIFDSLNFRKGSAYNIGNIGLLYAKQDKKQEAITNLKEAVRLLIKLGDLYPVVSYKLKLAQYSQEEKDFPKALEYAKHSLEIAEKNGYHEQIRDASLRLSIIFAQTDSFKNAYKYHKQYVAYRDSLNNEETIRKMADLRADYEIGQKQAEVDLLEEQQKRQNIVFIGLLVIIALLVIMVFLYYRNYKRKQALNMIITERKEEAEAQRDQLEAINETKEKFLSIISHDLLGPVNSFKGLSVIMQASIEQKNVDDLKQIHKLFDNSVENLSTLLTNLLDWSVTQQGAIPYNPEEINVAELVNELLHLFSNMALNKDINLSSTVGDKILVWADVNSLKTILRNLTSNAIKFTDQGGQITISAILDDDKVGIQVTDSGVGMAQEKIDELLAKDNFKRSSGTKGEKGVGLGLQLVKEFTEMNKGSMSIESTEEVGTKITVFLPLI